MKYFKLLIPVYLLLTACSPVNSMAPFDDKQAAIVAKSMLPHRSSAYSNPSIHDSKKNSTKYESEQ